MVTQIINMIRKIDTFGQGIEFTINKESKAKTIFGGFLTILMMLMCLSMFYLNVQDILYHRNPQLNIETKILTESPNITINNNTMPIAVGFLDSNLRTAYDASKFKIAVEFLHIKIGNTHEREKIPIKLKNCTKDSFPLISQQYYDNFKIRNHLCLENDIYLYGSSRLDVKEVYSLSITLSLCANTTESGTCAPLNDIKNLLMINQYFLGILIMDTSISPENYENPISYNIVAISNIIKLGTLKNNEIYVRNDSLESDAGILFPIKDINNAIAFDYSKYDDQNPIDGKLVNFSIYVSNRTIIYKRIYTKIQTVLASVGGIANVLRIAFTVCSFIFSVVKRDEVILNKVLEFDLTLDDDHSRKEEEDITKQVVILNINNEKKKHNNTPIIKNNEDNFTIKKKRIFNKNMRNQLDPGNFQSFDIKSKLFNKSNIINNSERENKNVLKTANLSNNDNSSANVKSALSLTKYNEKSSVNILEEENKSNALSQYDKIEAKSYTPENRNSKSPEQILDLIRNGKKSYQLKFSFCEVLRIFLCCKCCMNPYIQNKKALYDKSKFVVEEFLDISNIIQKFEEMEKLKIVLLNKNQLALFNFLSNELISLNQAKLNSHTVNVYKNFNKNQEALVDIIIKFRNKMLRNDKVKKIDKKLFNLLNPILK